MASLEYRCQQSTSSLLWGQKFRFIDNGGKVLGVAHCDSVRAGSNHYIKDKELVFCTSLDDRLGVHILLDVLPEFGLKFDVLLTDDEEIGRSTASLFQSKKQYNWIFQFDRRGTDAVTYNYDDMDPYASQHFELGFGSFSDICCLEHLKCGGINVGTGYHNEHTIYSFADLSDTQKQVYRFVEFFQEFKNIHIPGVKEKPWKKWKRNYRSNRYGNLAWMHDDIHYFDDDDEEEDEGGMPGYTDDLGKFSYFLDNYDDLQECPACEGLGEIETLDNETTKVVEVCCNVCDGTGWVAADKNIEV